MSEDCEQCKNTVTIRIHRDDLHEMLDALAKWGPAGPEVLVLGLQIREFLDSGKSELVFNRKEPT